MKSIVSLLLFWISRAVAIHPREPALLSGKRHGMERELEKNVELSSDNGR
jgi:hypothetical protein